MDGKNRSAEEIKSDLGITREMEQALNSAGFVIAPVTPTQRMIEEAYWSALSENAASVWKDMIGVLLAT